MEINIETVIQLYKNKLSDAENELIMSQALVIDLQKKINEQQNEILKLKEKNKEDN